MRSLRRYALPGSVLALLAFVYLIAWATGSGGRDPAATGLAGTAAAVRTAPVTAVARVCPPPAPGTGQAHVAFVAAPPRPAQPRSASSKPARTAKSSTTVTAIPAAGASAGAGSASGPSVPGALGFLSPPQASQYGGIQVTATGPVAQGFAAQQASADGTGTVTCAHPDSDEWFVGAGTQAGGSTSRLYLMNTGAITASADVTVLTDAGVQSGQDNEVTVPARRYLSVDLASQASGSTVLAVHVQTSAGQVTADVWQNGGSGGAWLPAAQSPATRVVLPGVTTQGGPAKLLVAVPGGKDAQLRVTALTARGKSEPLGASPQDAPAGASSSFPLNSLGAPAAALVVSSSVPVTASVQDPGSGIGAFTAAVAPLAGQGVVAASPSGGGDTVGLVLSAPGAPAQATIMVLGSSDAPSSRQTVTVQSGRTAEVKVSPPKGASGPFAIVITPRPGSGPLYAARLVVSGGNGLSGTLRSLLPVPSAPSAVALPPVSDSYSAVAP
jgi:hypothetical protein